MRTRFPVALLFLALPAFAQERPFTVDIMMQTQGIAETLFSPLGDRLLLEKTAAYNSSRNFAWERAWSRERATLLSIDVAGKSPPRMIAADPAERVWVGSYSPSGALAAVGWFDGDSAKGGIYDYRTGQLRKFDYRISNAVCAFDCPFWLSEETFLHYTLSADEQNKELSDIIYTDEMTHRWARHSWTGDEAVVKVSGSGANLTSSYAVGLSSMKAMEVASGLSFGAMWSEGGQGRMGVPPWQDPPRYIRNSPLFHADKIETPLLLVHGDYDFVNVNEAEQMFNALHRQGKDAQLLRYWGEGHVFRSPANIRDMWQRIFGWFDEHLDIARDAQGKVIFENHAVKSRGSQ